ncbi:MAG TPA: hypothetical protein VGR47_14015 [Terracidiphilus sp.]|nr:hypothetical protein [Terracidiphilus sp.]
MSTQQTPPAPLDAPADNSALPNGSGAAALLAAGIGALALAVISIAGDRIAAFGKLMVFYKPTGPLSGVTTCAIVIWLAVWVAFDLRWKRRNVALGRVSSVALVLLFVALLLTFPPIADLF